MLKATLFSFFVFIALGNLPRFFKHPLFSDHLLISEGVLYTSCLLSFFFLKFSARAMLLFFSFSLLILLSFTYGVFLHGFQEKAFFYALRVVFLCFSSMVLKEIFWIYSQGDVTKLFSFLFKGYAVSLVIGFTLYICFPAASSLWVLLSRWHIGFQGDPHVGRFVSVYLDPNYYAALCGFMILIASYLYSVTKKILYQVGAFLFALSGLLSWSRSGIFMLGALGVYRFFPLFLPGRFSKEGLKKCLTLLFPSFFFLCVYQEEILLFLTRTMNVFQDDSALCRFRTFALGFDLFKEFPLLGVGMNYLYLYTEEEVSLTSLDSSLLSLLVQIGAIAFIGLFLVGAFCALRLSKKGAFWPFLQPTAPHFFTWFSFYGALCLFFGSQFNNLLFYPFFFIPVVSTALYLHKYLVSVTDKSGYIAPNLYQGR